MLTSPPISLSTHFKMSLNFQKDVLIEFSDIFLFFKNKVDSKKIVFIDPIVLSNNYEFFELEASDPNLFLVPTNLHETNKDMDSLKSVLDILESHGTGRRRDIVCAIGGGALLDTVAFASSIFRRGIAIVKVPTTLLAVVDASIGIKTGVNYLGLRNRIGSYHFDFQVIIDLKLMRGLHSSLIRQGLGEIFKIAVIKSKELFRYIELNKLLLENIAFYETIEGNYLLSLCIKLMLEELQDNPREDNLVRCVDFGHSFSPLVEMESLKRVGFKSLPHGFAVAYDCILTATISSQRGILSDLEYQKILLLFFSFDFDFKNQIYDDHNLMWASFLEMTKHRGGNQNLPIPVTIGSYDFIQDLTFEEMQHCSIMLKNRINK